MCCECKVACHSRCCQLLNSCPASIMNLKQNFVWFTADKLLKCYNCSHQKRPKQLLLRTCGDDLTFTYPSKTVHQHTPLARCLNFLLVWLQPPCCLVLIWWTFFISESSNQVHHRSRVVIDSTSWDEQACTHNTLWCHCVVMNSKEYLINSHILSKYFELVAYFFSYIW